MSVCTSDNDFMAALECVEAPCSEVQDLHVDDGEPSISEDERRWFIKMAKRSYDFNKKSILIRDMH